MRGGRGVGERAEGGGGRSERESVRAQGRLDSMHAGRLLARGS